MSKWNKGAARPPSEIKELPKKETPPTEEIKKMKYRQVIADILEGMPQGKAFKKAGCSSKMGATPLFKECLAEIPDSWLLGRITEIARKADARASLNAIQMLFKLKDRFPAGKLKIQELGEELEAFQND